MTAKQINKLPVLVIPKKIGKWFTKQYMFNPNYNYFYLGVKMIKGEVGIYLTPNSAIRIIYKESQ